MGDKKRILVCGATGAQGGSVARELIRDTRYSVRCLTRRPDSETALALQEVGAEIARGDLSRPETVREALRGCDGVFGVTNYWEHFEAEREQGRNLVDAVADARTPHFVFSTLPSARALSGGELSVPHYDIKAELEAYARSRGLPATYVHVAFYYENFLTYFPPRRQRDGTWAVGFPQGQTPLAGVAVEDLGPVVREVLDRRDALLGRVVGVVGDELPPAEYARILSEVAGRTVRYHHVPREEFAGYRFPGAADLAAMFELNRRFIPDRRADLEACRRLNPAMADFRSWARVYREAILAAMM